MNKFSIFGSRLDNGSHFEFASIKYEILDPKNVGNDVFQGHQYLEMTKQLHNLFQFFELYISIIC